MAVPEVGNRNAGKESAQKRPQGKNHDECNQQNASQPYATLGEYAKVLEQERAFYGAEGEGESMRRGHVSTLVRIYSNNMWSREDAYSQFEAQTLCWYRVSWCGLSASICLPVESPAHTNNMTTMVMERI